MSTENQTSANDKPVDLLTDQELATLLSDGVSADIWYDAGDHDDESAQNQIDRIQEAMQEASRRLNAPQKETDLVTLNLNVFDNEGNVVDGVTSTLSLAQVSDIVDHACQVILMRRENLPVEGVLDELDEALSVSDVIEPLDATHEKQVG